MAETTTTSINNPLLPPNPTKFYTHFLYKAIFLSIFLLLLPLFPSEAPNFINHTINTTSWELLQLLFVGIAVSYGLFSKRTNDETTEKHATEKHDNVQSYVTRLLQVSSVFDDDSETPSPSENNNNSKIQTWNSQYYRGEPIVVVANENTSVLDHDHDHDNRHEKPLLLPVRSSKNRVSDSSSSIILARSNSRRRFDESTVKPEENIVFRSPIPWRSRSGRMEVKENVESQSLEEDSSEINNPNPIQSRSFRYQSSKPVSNLLSQSEIESKLVEGKKKSSSFSPIPPPPPPPPPPPQPHQPVKLNYSHTRFRRSLTNEDLENRRRRDFTIRSRSDASKSFRIPKEKEYDEYLSHDKEIESFLERRGSQKKIEEKKEIVSEESEEEEEDDELVELASKSNENMADYSDNGPDVDKKADEFIAKFREQIRLQRIASIRRSTTQTPNKNGIR